MAVLDEVSRNPNSSGVLTYGREGDTPGFTLDSDGNLELRGSIKYPGDMLNPLRFGAKGDGSTFDDAAFARMWAELPPVGGHIYLPTPYNFRLSQPLVTHSGLHISGGDRRRALITNRESSVFVTASSQSDMHFHDFGVNAGLSNGTAGGHIFDFTGPAYSGPYLTTWNNLYLLQSNPNKSIWYGPECQYLDNQVRDCWLVGNARTVPMIYLRSVTGSLGDNLFTDLRIDDTPATPTTWAIWLEEESGTTALGNTLQRLNFENPAGGAICLRGQNGADLRQIWFWDINTTTTNHLILLDKIVTGRPNVGVTLEKIARPGGAAMGVGLNDVYGSVGSHFGTTVRRCVTDGSQPLRIDLAYSPGGLVENCYGSGVSVQSYVFGTTIGAAAGTGAVVNAKAGTLYDGNVTINSGTTPSAGVILSVTWPNGLRSAPGSVTLTPMTTTAVDAGLYVTNLTAAGFDVASRNALPASTAGIRFALNAKTAVNG